jgi:hypothetical protein
MALNKRKSTKKVSVEIAPVAVRTAPTTPKPPRDPSDGIDINSLTRNARTAKLGTTSFDQLKEFLDFQVAHHGGVVPNSYSSSQYRPWSIGAWDFAHPERDKLNAMVGWLHVNSPLELTNNRGYLRKMEHLIKRNLYMTEVVDFSCHLEGLWLSKYSNIQARKTEVAKEKASNLHPIAQFVSEQKDQIASFAQIKKEFPDMAHIHSYLHYLVNKKGVLVKTGSDYKLVDEHAD